MRAMNRRLTKLCPLLWVNATEMGFWSFGFKKHSMTTGNYCFDAENLPAQDIIDSVLPQRLLDTYGPPGIDSLLMDYYAIVHVNKVPHIPIVKNV
ncbi:hypothetical protein WG66_014336 [Moniliophthora roreri]|nr:hypothetical protein WG66_014336 [Moniliophthora roreri]